MNLSRISLEVTEGVVRYQLFLDDAPADVEPFDTIAEGLEYAARMIAEDPEHGEGEPPREFVTVVLEVPREAVEGIDLEIAPALPEGFTIAATYPGDLVTDEVRQGTFRCPQCGDTNRGCDESECRSM